MSFQIQQINISKLNETILCFAETIYRFNGVWEGPDPLTPLISLFLIQLTFSMIVIHLLVFALKPFNQPPFIAELLGGILLGPSALGRISAYRRLVFPVYSFKVLEPMAHFSIVLYAFLVGLKMDLRAVLRTGPKSMKVAVSGTVAPFIMGTGLYYVFKTDTMFQGPERFGSLFWGATLTVTGFSVVTRVLDLHQILHTDVGKTTMGAALINDVLAWAFLAFAFALTSDKSNVHYSVIGTTAFILFCGKYLRSGLRWAIRKTPEGQGYSEFYICSLLTGMFLTGVLADALGTHPMIGAFIFGLIIPNEVLEAILVDKLEDFVVGILLPVYFVVCGLRTNIDDMASRHLGLGVVFVVIIVLCSAKVLSSVLVTFFTDLEIKDSVIIGVLCNTKSIMALIILEAGQIQGALSTQTYSVMVVAVLVMTMVVTPTAMRYRPMTNTAPYRRRTIQKGKLEEELRILACIYNTRNVPTTINLLRTSNSTQKSPISVFALQLVELVGRAATMLVVHSARKAGPRNPSHIEAQTDQIISAFDNYELRSEGVRTQTLTVRCAYTTMEDDICNIAKDKRATFIILPFHKQQTIDGEMEDINPSIRGVNEGILESAPCSVGILVDRGTEARDHASNIAVLFFSGPDDREALAYAWRMVENSNIRLTVVRFSPSSEAEVPDQEENMEKFQVSLQIDAEREKLLDDEYMEKFRMATANNERITYCELVLHDEEEAIKAIKSMDEHNHDLYMVGRGQGMVSPLTAGLADWCDCPELGPIGDLLVTSEFESAFSVLIVQQYVKSTKSREGSIRSASSVNYNEDHVRESVSGSELFESFSSFKMRDHDHH